MNISDAIIHLLASLQIEIVLLKQQKEELQKELQRAKEALESRTENS